MKRGSAVAYSNVSGVKQCKSSIYLLPAWWAMGYKNYLYRLPVATLLVAENGLMGYSV